MKTRASTPKAPRRAKAGLRRPIAAKASLPGPTIKPATAKKK